MLASQNPCEKCDENMASRKHEHILYLCKIYTLYTQQFFQRKEKKGKRKEGMEKGNGGWGGGQ